MTGFRSASGFVLFAVLSGAAGGCASSALEARIGLIEHELEDQRNLTKRMENRIDELQIQVGVLARKLATPVGDAPRGPSAGHPAASAESSAPRDLKVVHLQPPTPMLKLYGPSAGSVTPSRKKDRSPGWKLTEATLKPVDPAEVTERLAVDPAAGRRLLRGPVVEVADDPAYDARVEQEQAERARTAQDFHSAFELYRTNAFGQAAIALLDFARKHVDDDLAPEALFFAGKARMMLEQTREAEEIFVQLARDYPKGKRSAEALLLAGRCQERSGRSAAARGTYLQLVDAYPLSEQAGEANQRLQSIR